MAQCLAPILLIVAAADVISVAHASTIFGGKNVLRREVFTAGSEVADSLPAAAVAKPLDIVDVYKLNQKTRALVRNWITKEILKDSVFNYGLGPPMADLPKDVGPEPIQHDFVSQLGSRLQAMGEEVRYLELGVSVLKGIQTQANFFHGSSITSFDVEDPNPLISQQWNKAETLSSWEPSARRLAHNRSNDYIKQYAGPNSNVLFYVAGDATTEDSYKQLADVVIKKQRGPMNLILSDAIHAKDPVVYEVQQLLKHGIIRSSPGNNFAMVWDDCQGGVRLAFEENVKSLRTEFAGRTTWSGHLKMPGWVGINEGPHQTCVFTTFDLSGDHLQASETWSPLESQIEKLQPDVN